MTHFFNGLNILKTFRESLDNSPTSASGSETSLNIGFIDEYIAPIFSRISILSLLFDQPQISIPPPQWRKLSELPTPTSTPSVFSTLVECRNAMIDTCNPVIQFVTLPHVYRFRPDVPIDVQEQSTLEVRLRQWLEGFEAFLRRSETTLTNQDRQGATILRIQHKVVSVWLVTRGAVEQSSYDEYVAEFQSIITLVETMDAAKYSGLVPSPRSTGETERPPAFVFDLYVIPVLYFVAIKCRHPLIRRKAISLLSSSPRREGLWDAAPVARAAQRVMAIEEEPLDSPGRDDFPPEWSRVHDVDFKTPLSRPGSHQVRFETRPDGPDGEILSWDEYI